eukprot:14121137-Ditylum_brightwellii.AAC.1
MLRQEMILDVQPLRQSCSMLSAMTQKYHLAGKAKGGKLIKWLITMKSEEVHIHVICKTDKETDGNLYGTLMI